MSNCDIQDFENNKKRTSKNNITKRTSNKNKKLNIPIFKENSTPLSFDYKFKVDEFAMRGLNKFRNFMTAPKCDCECGVILKDKGDLYNFCGCMLHEHGCLESAIFVIHKDGTQEVILSEPEFNEENDEYEIAGFRILEVKNVDDFAQIDAGLRLCCYGLMIERDNGWEICE